MRVFLLAGLILILQTFPTFAGDLEDGVKFYASKDYPSAVTAFRKAAEQGIALAQYNLGIMYDKGLGVKQDYQQAVSWYHKAAEQGVGIAHYNLGVMYDKGLGVKQDYQQAVFWYRKAAEQGIALAQYNLGIMYDNGLGVEQDYQQAVLWYHKAAEQGISPAQYNLGAMYDNGLGVTQDHQQAIFWYRKAAEQDIAWTVQNWAKAWAEKNVAGYFSFYAAGFKTPGGLSLADWKASRRTQIEKPKLIEVLITDQTITFRDDSHAVVSFKQSYRSSLLKDISLKVLTLTKADGKWLIAGEEVKK